MIEVLHHHLFGDDGKVLQIGSIVEANVRIKLAVESGVPHGVADESPQLPMLKLLQLVRRPSVVRDQLPMDAQRPRTVRELLQFGDDGHVVGRSDGSKMPERAQTRLI